MNGKHLLVYFVSLGCGKNFVDTEVMVAHLLKAGIGITSDLSDADIYCINTCAFIDSARAEAKDYIKNAVKWKGERRRKKIIVTGCLTQWDKKTEFVKKFPEVDMWLGVDMLPFLHIKIIELVSEKIENKICANRLPKYLYDHNTPRLQLTPNHYAYIKIAEGCNNRCAYCSIPSIRGELRSRNISSIFKEAQNLVTAGVKELIIIAQDITAFADDKKNSSENLNKMLQEIDLIEGNYWIRLHYLHPKGINENLIETISKSKHIIHYLDIPLQHISDPILKAMNRKITKEQTEDVLCALKNEISDVAIRTTVLVGFPGETEDNFLELCEFIKKWKFERLGVFPYSDEEGTKAFKMKNKIEHSIAQERAKIVQDIHRENSLNFNKKLVGRTFNVIIDSMTDEYITGRTYVDSPDIDNVVKIKAEKECIIKTGDFVKAKIISASDFSLNGKILKK